MKIVSVNVSICVVRTRILKGGLYILNLNECVSFQTEFDEVMRYLRIFRGVDN